MPDDALRYYLNLRLQDSSRKLNMRDLIYLENYFAVSNALMLLRLKNMGVISEAETEQMKAGVISAAIRLGYSPALYQDTADQGMVIYSNYAELAEEFLEAGKITYGKYEELMLEGGYGEILFGDGEENGNSDAGNL